MKILIEQKIKELEEMRREYQNIDYGDDEVEMMYNAGVVEGLKKAIKLLEGLKK